ncbi:unnamed protein product [Parnassius mnemosyne]|uniref:Secreted protein n=1 Tax=Parnassius mnemosyne TaxID=213953 RepID=A0AAV1LHS3_9NEOP
MLLPISWFLFPSVASSDTHGRILGSGYSYTANTWFFTAVLKLAFRIAIINFQVKVSLLKIGTFKSISSSPYCGKPCGKTHTAWRHNFIGAGGDRPRVACALC